MLNAIENCLKLRQYMPALVLMYSLIDSIGWAASGNRGSGNVRSNFEAWVNEWLLPELKATSPSLTATDIFGARCAALHTLTGTSDLFSKGVAKRVMYAWGTGRVSTLQAVIAARGIGESHVAVHYDDLHLALCRASAKFFDHADNNDELFARLEEAARMHYAYISIDSAISGPQIV